MDNQVSRDYDGGMTETQRTPAAPARGRGRRSPSPAERQRDPERTRQRILDAATAEFAAKGYAGARVGEIADRAGVNKQLISYYFGGKEGLWDAIVERWWSYEATLETANLPLAEQAKPFVPTTDEERATARLLVWEGLGSPDAIPRDPKRDARMQQVVADLRRRQAAGELDPGLDPACVAVVLFAATVAPTVLPQIVGSIYQADPTTEEFTAAFAEQLSDVIRHLRPQT
jgi:TetR/AcrR family transcriptional regulator